MDDTKSADGLFPNGGRFRHDGLFKDRPRFEDYVENLPHVQVPSIRSLHATWAILLSDPKQRERAVQAVCQAVIGNYFAVVQFDWSTLAKRVERALDLLDQLPQTDNPRSWEYHPNDDTWNYSGKKTPPLADDAITYAVINDIERRREEYAQRKDMQTSSTATFPKGLSVTRVHGSKKTTISRSQSDQRESWLQTLDLTDEEFGEIVESWTQMRDLEKVPLR